MVHMFIILKKYIKFLEKNNISKKIKNYDELSKNLINDLKKIQKKNNKFSNLIKNLGQKKTLNDTMKNINNFLKNEIK